jgi:hypothetical protein
MQNSVQLNQLPHTGFDYGLLPNTLFWLALLVWSIFIAKLILRNTDAIAKLFATLAKVFIVQTKAVLPRKQVLVTTAESHIDASVEPVILTERVVEPELSQVQEPANIQKSTSIQEANTSQTAFMNIPNNVKENAEQAKERVKAMVAKELQLSREGQAPSEFSEDDFAIVDFDGVNPDDSWQAAGPAVQARASDALERLDKMREYAQESQKTQTKEEQRSAVPAMGSEWLTQMAQAKVYKDAMRLDTSQEYPRILLSREEVTTV